MRLWDRHIVVNDEQFCYNSLNTLETHRDLDRPKNTENRINTLFHAKEYLHWYCYGNASGVTDQKDGREEPGSNST